MSGPYKLLQWSTDDEGRPIVMVRGLVLSNVEAVLLRDELNRLLEPRETEQTTKSGEK
jgi:hypothetical protein